MPRPTPLLNQIYKTIAAKLDIPPKERPAIMAAGGERISSAFMGGYWRPPDDVRRFRLVTRRALRAWCVGLLEVRPPPDPAQVRALCELVAALDGDGDLSLEMVDAFADD